MNLGIYPKVGLGQITELEAEPQELVKDIIERAAVTQAINPETVALQHEGRPLDPERRLKELGISDGDKLEMVPKKKIGSYDPILSFKKPIPVDFKSRVSYEAIRIRSRRLPIYPIQPNRWEAIIAGRGRWRGKNYKAIFNLPKIYPYSPIKVDFLSQLIPIHPNIDSETGYVCLNILKKDWHTDYTMETVLDSLGWLLKNPNYDDPLPHYSRSKDTPLVRYFLGRRG
jgi:ubiquitin-protein ligase